MNLADYLAEVRGRHAQVAREVGVASAYLSQMAGLTRPVPPALVPALFFACEGRVECWDLRPQDWHLIWPGSVGRAGAPEPHSPVTPRTTAAASGMFSMPEVSLSAAVVGYSNHSFQMP